MRAVRTVDGAVTVVEVPEPAGAGDGVVVDVSACGICGSDLHLLSWGLPVTLGHELAGRLVDGTPVAVQPSVPCGSCEYCRAGQSELCTTLLERMYGVSLDGGLAEQILVDASCIVPLPTGLDPAAAALAEPLAVGVHAANQGGVQAGQRVLVVGGGSVGLLTAAAARAMGADVDISVRHDRQRQAADAIGAGLEPGGGYDVVFDAAGTQTAIDVATDQVRPGGTIVVVATYWSPVEIGIALLMKEAHLVPATTYGDHGGRREYATAVDLLATMPDLFDAVVTHRFNLSDAPEAFRAATDRQGGAIKILLEP
jgi:2-desacetyl-2-hydroxyethyl bacteriochlorophyllide A dehydrogenase